jgi:hypothetical protein
MSTRKKNVTGVRPVLDKTSKSRDKNLQDAAGDGNQDAEDNHAEDHDVFDARFVLLHQAACSLVESNITRDVSEKP